MHVTSLKNLCFNHLITSQTKSDQAIIPYKKISGSLLNDFFHYVVTQKIETQKINKIDRLLNCDKNLYENLMCITLSDQSIGFEKFPSNIVKGLFNYVIRLDFTCKVKVKLPENKILKIKIFPSETVEILKKIIGIKIDVSPHHFKLLYKGYCLKNLNKDLFSYNFEKGKKVSVKLKYRNIRRYEDVKNKLSLINREQFELISSFFAEKILFIQSCFSQNVRKNGIVQSEIIHHLMHSKKQKIPSRMEFLCFIQEYIEQMLRESFFAQIECFMENGLSLPIFYASGKITHFIEQIENDFRIKLNLDYFKINHGFHLKVNKKNCNGNNLCFSLREEIGIMGTANLKINQFKDINLWF
ncbi:ubiquitin-like protein [Parachlamydia acanthamoebae]|jgi:hypothetical protein|uniref:Ubiquitin-like domain-containing protein n=2 Tax=Parachlamydia acanthamoebae TaxID=83552 RepID=A0A0C1C2Z0_9BACT|nr:ubiquitin-like protein [Parachlamydia acanthamoebae]EFB41772.1 hypothetical protein pah_c022o047 [Parachlamydia acanthamoebae str. Hall's coccus]KIA77931.1 hypothetical protein DB43_FJ00090 [Parachlamydia acanthamoebae]